MELISELLNPLHTATRFKTIVNSCFYYFAKTQCFLWACWNNIVYSLTNFNQNLLQLTQINRRSKIVYFIFACLYQKHIPGIGQKIQASKNAILMLS